MSIEIELSQDTRVETWWLARESARNAISLQMWNQLRDAALAVAPGVRVVVIRGRGKHFSAGADIKGLGRTLAGDDDSDYRAVNSAAESAIAAISIPTVAAINGFCMGGAVQLALACDLRIATRDSQFAITPAKLGIVYPATALRRLVTCVGASAASELLLTAQTIDAARAYELGLISRVVDDLASALAQLIETLMSQSPFTQRATKAVISALINGEEIEELGRQLEQSSLEHPDLSEGLAAFSEKRRPDFR
jgi:enoyl-CoA hydratase/carnithine racemase